MASRATASEQVRVNTTTTYLQFFSTVTALEGGGWVTAWSSLEDAVPSVWLQCYDASGRTIGRNEPLSTATTGYQSASSVAALPDGGFIVTWNGSGAGTDADGIFQQRFTVNGTPVGAAALVSNNTSSSQFNSSVTVLEDSGWLVTWYGNPIGGDFYAIHQQRFTTQGAEVGAELVISNNTTIPQYMPATTALADGGWVVAWYGLEFSTPGDGYGIYQERYDADGNLVGASDQIVSNISHAQQDPAVVALPDGGWIVAWQATDGDENLFEILYQRYAADGSTVGGQVQANSYSSKTQEDPAIAVLADGGWVVVWEGIGAADEIGFSIYQQRYDQNGKKVGTETSVEAFTSNFQTAPSVTALKDGGWVVSWEGVGVGDAYGIYQRHFAPDISGGAKAETLKGTVWGERITGLGGDDRLTGRAGADVIDGGRGRDLLTGGGGGDTFVFATGYGRDRITDFAAAGADHDVIDLSKLQSVTSYADLRKNHMSSSHGDVVIDGGKGDVLVLDNTSIKGFDANDFQF